MHRGKIWCIYITVLRNAVICVNMGRIEEEYAKQNEQRLNTHVLSSTGDTKQFSP